MSNKDLIPVLPGEGEQMHAPGWDGRVSVEWSLAAHSLTGGK